MKKNIVISFLVTASILILMACGKSEEKSTTVTADMDKFEPIEIKDENIQLRYNFSKGDKFKYKLTTVTNSEESVKTDSTINSKLFQTLTYIFDLDVLEIDEDKVAEIGITISSIKLEANVNGQLITFDSKGEYTPEEKQRFLEYATISNSPYRARVSSRGEVIEVTRLDKMIEKMNELQNEPQKLTIEQKAQLSKNLSEAALRPLTQLIFRELPEKSVAKDSTWTRNYPAQMNVFNIQNVALFKIDDFINIDGNKGAKISANLSATWSGNKKGEEEGVQYQFDDPIISGNGKIIFDIDNGQLIKAETLTSIELSVEVKSKDSLQKMQTAKRNEKSTNKNTVELL
ncbi:MAG: DUF6263 family protein [Melioribacteraceae bacterium]|nr:DUF6263 family protein [Melioribacteraceae bacterium]